jgi:hypothetical protein
MLNSVNRSGKRDLRMPGMRFGNGGRALSGGPLKWSIHAAGPLQLKVRSVLDQERERGRFHHLPRSRGCDPVR